MNLSFKLNLLLCIVSRYTYIAAIVLIMATVNLQLTLAVVGLYLINAIATYIVTKQVKQILEGEK